MHVISRMFVFTHACNQFVFTDACNQWNVLRVCVHECVLELVATIIILGFFFAKLVSKQ